MKPLIGIYKFFRNNINLKLSDFLTLFVAIVALFISIRQGKTQTNIDLANSSPYLQFTFNEVNREPIKGIKISNLGTGPAKVISFKYYLNEKQYNNSVSQDQWLPHLEDSLQYIFEYINNIPKDFILGSRDSYYEMYLLGTTAMNLSSKNEGDAVGDFYNSNTKRVLKDLIIEVEYMSLNSLDKNIYLSRFSVNDDSLKVSRQVLP